MMKYPWSAVTALVYVYALVVIYLLSQTHPRLRRLYSGRTCIITVALAMVMILLFGFTGFERAWYYYVVMLAMVSSMGLDMMDDLWHLKQRRPAMVLSHVSVFIVLVAGLFGSADKQTVRLSAYLDQPVSQAVTEDGMSVDLPFMLTLKSFTIDQYAPKLYLKGGDRSESFEISGKGAEGLLGGWNLTALESYDMAMPEEDAFRELKHVGAEPAVLVKAVNRLSGEVAEGWVSCGSFMFEPAALSLPGGEEVVMGKPMPKKYQSVVAVTDAKGREHRFDIAVNHPARIGKWRLYQEDYDSSRGRWSNLSVLLCVKDPWYPMIEAGLWMVLLAALLMFVTAGLGVKNKER